MTDETIEDDSPEAVDPPPPDTFPLKHGTWQIANFVGKAGMDGWYEAGSVAWLEPHEKDGDKDVVCRRASLVAGFVTPPHVGLKTSFVLEYFVAPGIAVAGENLVPKENGRTSIERLLLSGIGHRTGINSVLLVRAQQTGWHQAAYTGFY